MSRATSASDEPPDPERSLRSVARDVAASAGGGVEALHAPGGGGTSDDDAQLGLDVLRGLADQELARADHAGARSRQAFALAAGFFAVVQTVAFGAFATTAITHDQRVTLVHRATLAGVLLAACGALLIVADSAFRSREMTPDRVLDTINEARDSGTSIRDEFIELYALVVDERRRTNRRRFFFVGLTQILAVVTIATTLWELIVSLHFRV